MATKSIRKSGLVGGIMAFETIVGNQKIKEMLTKTINANKILNGYMFVGKEGIRKNAICKRIYENDTLLKRGKQALQ